MKTKFTLRNLAATFGLCLGLSSAAWAGEEVRISTVTWIGYAGLYVADEMNLFEPHGVSVKVNMISDNAMLVTDLKEGRADAATLTYDQVLNAVAGGADIKVVLPMDYSAGGDAVVAPKSIAGVAELKGKKVGFNYLGPPEIMMAYALQQNGLSEKDIEAVNLTADSIPGALESARIEAGATYEPNISGLLKLGGGNKYHVIFSSKEAPGLITDVLVFNARFIQDHPKAVEGVVKGYVDALKHMQENADDSAGILSMVMGIPKSNVPDELSTVHIPPLEEMPAVFDKNSKAITSFFNSGKLIGEILLEKQAIKQVPEIAGTFDASFVEALLANK
jgi:NitT/TauT family transport system substrate-binding protein